LAAAEGLAEGGVVFELGEAIRGKREFGLAAGLFALSAEVDDCDRANWLEIDPSILRATVAV
jgi:hypothetical protein